jgi:polysaccharide export outer membrane protein
MTQLWHRFALILTLVAGAFTLASCETPYEEVEQTLPANVDTGDYVIGPLDMVEVFVWRAPDVSVRVPVRPDGKISTPLVEDMIAAGKTPSQLARDLENELRTYIQDPVVTVIVQQFQGPFTQRVRVVGEASQPVSVPYRAHMTVLDVMIDVGGLTQFAAGNNALLIRGTGDTKRVMRVRLDDLLKEGDISANAPVAPGDVILIPESFF